MGVAWLVVGGCSKGKADDGAGEKVTPAPAAAAATPTSSPSAAARSAGPAAAAWADPELKRLADAFAACPEKNTNCAAYGELEAYMEAPANDDTKKKANFDAMMACVDAGPVERINACAYAAWAFSGYAYEAPKDPSYGRRLLAALRTLKTDEESYAGSSVGQFLASWLTSSDAGLRADLAVAMRDKRLEKRGRGELFRLCAAECLAHPELFDAVLATARDATEDEAMRIATIGSLWRVGDGGSKAVETFLVATMGSSTEAPRVAMAAMQDLAYMGSIDGYPAVIATIKAHAKEPDWTYPASAALTTYFQKADLAIDHAIGVDAALALIGDEAIPGGSRAAAVSALACANDSRVDGVLKKLAAHKDASLSGAATQGIAARKQRAEESKTASR